MRHPSFQTLPGPRTTELQVLHHRLHRDQLGGEAEVSGPGFAVSRTALTLAVHLPREDAAERGAQAQTVSRSGRWGWRASVRVRDVPAGAMVYRRGKSNIKHHELALDTVEAPHRLRPRHGIAPTRNTTQPGADRMDPRARAPRPNHGEQLPVNTRGSVGERRHSSPRGGGRRPRPEARPRAGEEGVPPSLERSSTTGGRNRVSWASAWPPTHSGPGAVKPAEREGVTDRGVEGPGRARRAGHLLVVRW